MGSTQVPEGYKQTEIGVIPKDWELQTIGDLASVSSGGTPSRINPAYWNGSIPWITTTQIDFNVINDAEQFITQDGLTSSAAKLFPPGTLLMAMYGQGKTRGKVAILGVKASTNQACAAILLNKNLESSYIFHYLINQYEAIRNLSNTGNQENLNGLIIKSIKIPLPPLPEQRSIAQALSDVDALIAALDKLIAKNRHLKTATMQQLLTGKMRLPGFKGEWEVKLLGEIAGITMGQSPSSIFYNSSGSGLPLVQGNADIGNRKTKIRIYTSQITKRCHSGDIILSVRAPVGEVAKTYFDACIGRGVCAVSYPNDFLYHLLILMEPQWHKLSRGSTFDSVNATEIKSLEIKMPKTMEEQKSIAQVLSNMDTEITALETRRAKTQAIKQGMMQELLTGRTRLI
jgi:type I restriction enzyme, S subunit